MHPDFLRNLITFTFDLIQMIISKLAPLFFMRSIVH